MDDVLDINIRLGRHEMYKGNPNLKRHNVKLQLSQDMVEEYIKCHNNLHHFCKYVKITNLDESTLVRYQPWDFQQDMLDIFHENRFSICKLPRQSGKSTTVIAYMLWMLLFNENYSVALLAHRAPTARMLLARLRLAYENLPKWMQRGVVEWNKSKVELDNGSKILAEATAGAAVRGDTYNLIFLDEFAFVPNNMAEDFFNSTYPTISSGKTSKIIIVSTPYGMNHFYRMWTEAVEERSEYVPIAINWYDVPGRDEEFKQQTIKNTSAEQWSQEFECEFLGSTDTLISPTKLKNLTFVTPIHSQDGLDIYTWPEDKHNYTVVCDCSEGGGGDFSAFSVIDVTTTPYIVVGKYRSNTISSLFYPNVIMETAKKYNNAIVLIELNNIGGQVADILYRELEYENIITTTVKGRGGQVVSGGFGKNVQFGVKTTKTVKATGCSNLKTLVENDKLLIEDLDIIQELSTFVKSRTSFEAEQGAYDDCVMTLVLFSWLVDQPYFKEMTDINIRERLIDENSRMVREDVLPFGYIDDGRPDTSYVDAEGDRWFPVNGDSGW